MRVKFYTPEPTIIQEDITRCVCLSMCLSIHVCFCFLFCLFVFLSSCLFFCFLTSVLFSALLLNISKLIRNDKNSQIPTVPSTQK